MPLQHSPIAANDMQSVQICQQNVQQKLKQFHYKPSISPPAATVPASSSSAAAAAETPARQPSAKRMREPSTDAASPEPSTLAADKDVDSMSPEIMKSVLITVRELRGDMAVLKSDNGVFHQKISEIEKSIQFNSADIAELKGANEALAKQNVELAKRLDTMEIALKTNTRDMIEESLAMNSKLTVENICSRLAVYQLKKMNPKIDLERWW